ncbi:SWIM-type domain-containing protein [Heracleum sosnowskyi]|uniref:Protein FAR1-RELATED SEQUENCE n=1 Tax=Heracleum sosnowskyi TaxID=360622 RepID=A0AAD8JNR9_9APIA|nr:SWIM-type domain-containing protein [Heracleum sosnowskyi]
MEEGPGNTEELIGDEDSDPVVDIDQVFGIESVDLENDNGMLRIECQDLEDESQRVVGVESNDFSNDNGQPLQFDGGDLEESDQVFAFESNDGGNDNDQMIEIANNGHLNGLNGDTPVVEDQNDGNQGRCYPPPVVGMEFKSYDDAYNYYNCYAKDLGFAVRVKSSWTKRNSKEKRGAVLCCNCEGFKTLNEASSRRKETRTGCLAMVRLRLVECNKWRVDQVLLQHNHLFDPDRAQNSKSHKKIDAGTKRKLEKNIDVEVRTIKLYRTPATDAVGYGSSNERERGEHASQVARLKLGNGDAQVLSSYFTRAQLINPNFFYVMDFNDEGFLRNVFWIDSRSRAAYMYFSDVIAVDTTCLSNKYEIPLVAFLGVNHHGHSILLGCGLLADESLETYIWLFRAWLTCMLGRPPQTIITYQCRALQSATAEVFPRAHHRLCLPVVIQSVLQNLGELGESVIFQTVLHRAVYSSMKVDDFEMAWDDMIKSFGIRDVEFLRTLYEERERWAPVYFKDTVFAGMSISQPGKSFSFFSDDNVHRQTSLKEFFDIYDSVLQKSFKKEALADYESKLFTPLMKTKSSYELQLTAIYTKEICLKLQDEVEMMSSCISVTQINANGTFITFMVKERDADGITSDVKNFEVMYDKIGQEVRCTCSCFNFYGFLCRHALSVLYYNDIQEVPGQYVLQRWRRDVKRFYEPDLGSNYINISNPVQWFDHLHRRVTRVVEEGIPSEDHYMVAWQALKESLNKVRLVAKEAC